jgi:hypothetical protein
MRTLQPASGSATVADQKNRAGDPSLGFPRKADTVSDNPLITAFSERVFVKLINENFSLKGFPEEGGFHVVELFQWNGVGDRLGPTPRPGNWNAGASCHDN